MAVYITVKGINSAVWLPRSTRAFNRMRQGGVQVGIRPTDYSLTLIVLRSLTEHRAQRNKNPTMWF